MTNNDRGSRGGVPNAIPTFRNQAWSRRVGRKSETPCRESGGFSTFEVLGELESSLLSLAGSLDDGLLFC